MIYCYENLACVLYMLTFGMSLLCKDGTRRVNVSSSLERDAIEPKFNLLGLQDDLL